MQFGSLVVGAGSVGQHHVTRCIRRYGRTVVVEPHAAAKERVKSLHGSDAIVVASIQEASLALPSPENCVAVVANWGPDHFSTVEQLVDLGVRRILVEKPATNSLSKSARLLSIAASGVTIIAGLQRRFSGLAAAVRNASLEHCGSEPSSIVATGGALDVSTTGVHLLDLATDIFQEMPMRVTGDGGSARINPRSNALLYWDGVVVWTFKSGRRFSLHFDNRSSISSDFRVYARDGYITVHDGTIDVAIRDPARRAAKITRHGPPTEVFVLDVRGKDDPYERIFEALEQETDSVYPVEEALMVNDALLCGLHAIEHRASVELPAGSAFTGFATDWPAS